MLHFRAQVRSSLRLSKWEAVAFALMVGLVDAYFVADAVRLGASTTLVGLVVSLPLAAGGLGSVLAAAGLTRIRRRKPLVAVAASAQAVNLLLLAFLEGSGRASPRLVLAAACVHQACGMAAGTGWSSWYGDLVPHRLRGRYFSRRTRIAEATTCAGMLAAGLLLQHIEPAMGSAAGPAGHGFALLFGLGGLFRLGSVALLARSHEPRFHRLTGPRRTLRFLETRRGQGAGRVLLAGATIQFATYLAAPYFTPFMLGRLHFTYFEYTLAALSVVAGKSLLLPLWGRQIDRRRPVTVYRLAVVLVALVPLPWLFARGLLPVVGAQLFSGISWGGYEVSYFTVLLESSYRRTRAHVFAAHNTLAGLNQLLGGLAGAHVLALVGGDFRLLFLISSGARLAAGLLARWRIAPVVVEEGPVRLTFRVLGFRPHGGLAHRPVLEEGAEHDDDLLASSTEGAPR